MIVQSSITAQEFTQLYSHWVGQGGTPRGSRRCATSLNAFRSLLILREFSVDTLDLHMGILINESNRLFLTTASTGTATVGIVSAEWLEKVQTLWFMVDVNGFSFLTIDGVLM